MQNNGTTARTGEFDRESVLYHQLFDAVPCYVSVQDRDFRIIQANKAFKDAFGNRINDLCYRAYKGRNTPCKRCTVALAFQDGCVHSGEETVQSQGGNVIHMMVFASPLKTPKNEVSAVMEMSVDITEVKQLQERLASLGALIAGISHSIKGVAMGLDGGLYVVNSGFRSRKDEVIEKGWDMVQRNVRRISDMVLDILYCSRERKPNYETASPGKIANEVCDLLERKAEEHDVALRRSFPNDLDDFSVDPERIHAVLVNLITNGIDACFNDPNEIEHVVELSIEQQPDKTLFHVSDNGVGMDEDTRENLFSVFQSTKGSGGTGLGLFMSRKIAQEHGGDIQVVSMRGQGSIFTLRIPR
ncbi:MAG: ATP-binding protein [bacterium]